MEVMKLAILLYGLQLAMLASSGHVLKVIFQLVEIP